MATVTFPENPTEGQKFQNTSVSSQYSEWWIYKDGMWCSDIVASLPDREIGITPPYHSGLSQEDRASGWPSYPNMYISSQNAFNNWQLHAGEKLWRDMRRIVNSIEYQSYPIGSNGSNGDPSIGAGTHLIPVTKVKQYSTRKDMIWPIGEGMEVGIQFWSHPDKGFGVHKGDI